MGGMLMSGMAQNLGDQMIAMAPKIYMGLLVLFIFWIIGIIAEKVAGAVGEKAHIHKNIITLLGRIIRTVLVILGFVCALGTMGIDVSALVASLGLTGFALGFALRDALSNVLAGVLVLIYRPFQCGDSIKVTGFEGRVVEIDLRYTTLQTNGTKVLIPNSSLFNNPVVISEKKSEDL